MFKNYIISAFRNIKRNKLSSVISIVSLSFGLLVLTFYILLLSYEFSIDQWPEDSNRIFRLVKRGIRKDGTNEDWSNVGINWGSALKNKFDASIEDYLNITHQTGNLRIFNGYRNQPINQGFFFVSPSYFDFFDNPRVSKYEKLSLAIPNQVLITKTASKLYFGRINPIGETIALENPKIHKPLAMKIAGVIDDPPEKSHLQYSFLASDISLKQVFTLAELEKDHEIRTYCYLKLKNGKDKAEFGETLRSFTMPFDAELMAYKQNYTYLEPLQSIYFSNVLGGIPGERRGNRFFLFIIGIIVIFLNSVASLNVAYLIISRFSYRQEEIIIRKILGARSRDLVMQLLTETILLSFFALIVSLSMTELLLPFFNEVVNRSIEFLTFENLFSFVLVFLITALIGALSGLFPALNISNLKLSSVKEEERKKSRKIRIFLLSGQFVLSILLFFITIMTIHQVDYLKEKISVENEDYIYYLEMNQSDIIDRLEDLKSKLLQIPMVISVTASSQLGWREEDLFRLYFIDLTRKRGKDLNVIYVDPDYIKTFNYKIEKFIDGEIQSKPIDFVINRAAQNAFAWDDATNKSISRDDLWGEIRGVVEDFNFMNPIKKVDPLVLIPGNNLEINRYKYLILRLDRNLINKADLVLNEFWSGYFPGHKSYFKPYIEELNSNLNEVFGDFDWFLLLAAVVSLVIAFTGLFGLVSYDIHQRLKEIGIRRIMGASWMNIFFRIFHDFSLPVLFAHLIALPLSLLLFITALNILEYPHPIIFYWYDFLFTLCISSFLSLLSIGIQMLRTLSLKPVRTLQMT